MDRVATGECKRLAESKFDILDVGMVWLCSLHCVWVVWVIDDSNRDMNILGLRVYWANGFILTKSPFRYVPIAVATEGYGRGVSVRLVGGYIRTIDPTFIV